MGAGHTHPLYVHEHSPVHHLPAHVKVVAVVAFASARYTFHHKARTPCRTHRLGKRTVNKQTATYIGGAHDSIF
jgi:hypothetical protein